VADIWNWITNLDEYTINSIPEIKRGDDLRKMDLEINMRNFLGFVVNSGVAYPHNVATKWFEQKNELKRHKDRLLKYCGKLTHWK
jgi:hypothetical protein